MKLNLKGRTALISGASTGIGANIAHVLAGEGVRLAITARRDNYLKQVASEIRESCAQSPIVISGDMTNPADIERVATDSISALGHVDILVNCAGGSRPTEPFATDAHWEEAFALNFSAARRLTQAVLPGMRSRQWGRVINLSGSMEPRSLNAATAAKGALHLWAKGLSCDLAAEGVTINTIAPGRINSEQVLNRLHPSVESRQEFILQNIPIGYFGEPEDIGHVVGFLASPLARYITGAVIPVDGGMHFFSH